MSLIGSGGSNHLPGGIFDFNLLSDQSSATNVQKNNLGLFKDLINIPLDMVGYTTLWKYDAQSNKPSLGHPVFGNMRMDSASTSTVDTTWKGAFDKLKDSLREVREDTFLDFQHNSGLPYEAKNPTLVALGKVLEGTAKVMVWVNDSLQSLDSSNPSAGPDSELRMRQSANIGMTSRSVNGIVSDSQQLFGHLSSAVLNLGADSPHFDHLVGMVNDIGSSLSAFHGVRG